MTYKIVNVPYDHPKEDARVVGILLKPGDIDAFSLFSTDTLPLTTSRSGYGSLIDLTEKLDRFIMKSSIFERKIRKKSLHINDFMLNTKTWKFDQ